MPEIRSRPLDQKSTPWRRALCCARPCGAGVLSVYVGTRATVRAAGPRGGVGGKSYLALGRRRARMPKREGYTQPSLRGPGLRGSQSSTLRPAVGLFRKAVGRTRSGHHAERGVCCNGMCHGLARAERPARQEHVAAARMARVLCPAHVRLEILIPRKARLGRPASVPLHAPAHRSALELSVPVASASPI